MLHQAMLHIQYDDPVKATIVSIDEFFAHKGISRMQLIPHGKDVV